jgi:hypothetical protein
MILDNEIHRGALLSLLETASIKGADLDEWLALREAIKKATCSHPEDCEVAAQVTGSENVDGD